MTALTQSLLQWLRPASHGSEERRLGPAEAAFERGHYLEALKLWKRASQNGDAEADYRIGMLYAKNQGVVGSIPDAVVWCERAAQRGHAEAQYQLGLIYLYGVNASLGPNRPETWRQSSAARLGDTASNVHHLIPARDQCREGY
ncbi:hypothetical protein ACH79_15835 [Bradyrhizobium sp. CCBAU 051011]|uniref:tetratricopeptide repeat protein n=1 Tax=Bradyrhizobium sp. CCBAU 051011 TaxID=858422 RepID=UPI00137461E1|nr:tetratricopeptide repeat protein [Bradyrhizobium sp. CCBAU 051011]QHO73894.1 hypothetical protein ACH79_15835 [Bradyrhizobium sp. CCBAU 051011]